MPKRVTYLRRRDDLDVGRFRTHWSGPHARIAIGLPGVTAYRQNHIIDTWSPGMHRVDGIVELWFSDDEDAAAGYASAVADQLIADEPTFLSGLIGAPMIADAPPEPCPVKVWILPYETEESTGASVHEWADDLSRRVQASGYTIDEREPGGRLLLRQTLTAQMDAPGTAIALRFASTDDAASHRGVIVDAVSTRFPHSAPAILLTEEVVII